MTRPGRRRAAHAQDAAAKSVAPGGLRGGVYRPLAEADVRRVVDSALEVLERPGIEVMPSSCRFRLLLPEAAMRPA